MTPETTSVTAAPAPQGGTVFDIGYQRYTGDREGRARSRRAVLTDGLRAALGLGRGAKAKVLPWFLITVLIGIALVLAMVAGAALALGGPEAVGQVPSHSDYYGIASILLYVLAAVIGPELLCPDRREGVIHLYLVRPLTGSDYIAARWAACILVLTAAAWVPQLILLVGLSMGNPDPVGYLINHWLDLPRFLLAGVVFAAYLGTLAMLTASFTTRRAYASVFLVGLFALSTPFTAGLATELDAPVGQWVSMFNLTNIPVHVNDVIFGDVSLITEPAPARELPATTLVSWYLGWTVLPALLLWSRYRKLTP